MKKYFFVAIVLFLLVINFTYGTDENNNFLRPRLPPRLQCDDFWTCLGIFFDKILKVIVVLAIGLSAVFISYAGILYITQGSAGEKGKEIHKKIVWATVGLIVALMSYSFVKILEIWLSNVEQKI